MKKLFGFLFIFIFGLLLIGCKEPEPEPEPEPEQPIKYTVQFYVNDDLFKTLKIEENKTIGSSNVDNPVLEGFNFVAWIDEKEVEVDLDTYQVKSALKLHAKFEEVKVEGSLDVEQVKEEGASYFLVIGWWETTAQNEDGTPKITSSLTPDTVRVFYANVILYLKAWGATEDQIAKVQFRNYSTEKVAEMGAKINSDADVDLMIGVGNNINSSTGAQVSLFEGNDGKTKALMGTKSLERYVALPEHEEMNKVAISLFDWIKTEVGQKAFTSAIQESEIVVAPERTDTIDLTVTVNGLTGDPVVTKLTSKDDVIAVPEIVVPEKHRFLGYAVTKDSTSADIIASLGATLTFAQVEALANGQNTLELFPVLIEEVIELENELDVYVHVVSSSKISTAEASLFALRFQQLVGNKKINYVWVTEGKAADFLNRVLTDIEAGINIDVVIGGNATTSKLSAIDETYINESCAAGHFADASRKVIVLSSVATAHLELAKQFYDFMRTEAPELTLDIAYWAKWVTADEISKMNDAINTILNQVFSAENAQETYKLKLQFHTTTKDTLEEIVQETASFNAGLVIGTEEAASGLLENIIEQKDCSQSIIAAGRKVALCSENFLYQEIYSLYFTVA